MKELSTERIVDTVLTNLHGRKGVGDELDAIDDTTYAEMRRELCDAVEAEASL
jgi:hypothetical protein